MNDPFAPLTGDGSPQPVSSGLPEIIPTLRLPAAAEGEPCVPCTCGCGCIRPTALTAAAATSTKHGRMAAPTVRCDACRVPGHYMPTIDLSEQARLDMDAAVEQRRARHDLAVAQWRERVPAKFQHADVSDDEFIADRIARFREGMPSGFIVTGSYGSGKTWTSFGFLNALVAADLVHPSEILFGRENELLGIMSMGGFDEREAARRRIMNPRHRIVYIDDAGQGNFRSERDAHTIWHEFVDNMWSTDRVILVSTNYSLDPGPASIKGTVTGERTPSQFERWVGEAAFDRLAAISGYAVEVLGGGEERNHRRLNTLKAEQEWRGAREDTPTA